MSYRIKTSTITAENLTKIQNKYHFSTRAAILRICISLSLKEGDISLEIIENLDTKLGFDISLQTLFGDEEVYYRCMINYLAGKKLDDNDYSDYVVSHIERGMTLLYGDFVITHSLKEFIEKIV